MNKYWLSVVNDHVALVSHHGQYLKYPQYLKY